MSKILIIDDDKDFADATASMLQIKQYDTVVAYDADSALDKIDESVDVILSDIRLGAVDGSEFITEMREYTDVPIIMITAFSNTESAIQSVRNRAYDYLAKPCDPDILLKTIASASKLSEKKKLRDKTRQHLLNELYEVKTW